MSAKLSKESKELDEDTSHEEVVEASAKFIIPWMHNKLIVEVLHNKLHSATDSICEFQCRVEDFRVIGKTNHMLKCTFKCVLLPLGECLLRMVEMHLKNKN